MLLQLRVRYDWR